LIAVLRQQCADFFLGVKKRPIPKWEDGALFEDAMDNLSMLNHLPGIVEFDFLQAAH